jgi:hypothetical protein
MTATQPSFLVSLVLMERTLKKGGYRRGVIVGKISQAQASKTAEPAARSEPDQP